jgi:hypothetical protein
MVSEKLKYIEISLGISTKETWNKRMLTSMSQEQDFSHGHGYTATAYRARI